MAQEKWSCLDKAVLVSFCINLALLVSAVALAPWLGWLMTYPIIFQVIKTLSLGANIFGCRMNCFLRWGAAVSFTIIMAVDALYFSISYAAMAVIDEGDCNQEYNAQVNRNSLVTDCDEFKKQFAFWTDSC